MRETIETQYTIQGFFGKYRPLSNYYLTPFTINSDEFKSGEHAFHFYKTQDINWRRRILDAKTPSEAKKLGRQCPMREDWDEIKPFVVVNFLIHKFSQNKDLKDLLLSTGYKYLEETNDWNDTYWGVCNGKGENKLGKALMFVRAKLLTEDYNY